MTSIITTEDTLNTLVHAYVGREQEVHLYQININNFLLMLNSLPTDSLPSNLTEYLSTEIKDLPHSLSDDEVQLIADYKYRDELISRVRTEKAEQSKAKRVLDVIKSQIPADQFDALIAQAVQSV